MASNFYDVRPSTSRDANELSFPIKTSSSSENIQSHNNKPKKLYLSLATGGFGLREKETEEEKRKREVESNAYALFGQRCKKENDETKNEYINKDYDKELINHFNKSSLNSTDDNEKYQIGSDYIPLSKFKSEFEEADQDDLEIYHDPHYNLLNPNYNMNLPIYRWRKNILDSIRTNNVIIIQGNTGCGKTTQVPQYILDYYASINKKCNIIVTQPRRLAAISIARRVCEERGWNLGSICGYRISREAKVSPVTRISYVTTGFLLAQAIGLANALNSYTHIVLDEVHDRELDIDLILLIVKILLISGYNGKIILMSATLNPEELENYFDNVSIKKKVDLVKCSYELHKVKQYYLNEIKSFLKSDLIIPEFDFDEPKLMNELVTVTSELLMYFDKKENEANKDMAKINGFLAKRGSVLIFVPGMDEIRRIEDHLKKNLENNMLSILPLHSEIALEQQLEVFKRAQAGYRKVIISTSIAESSITVDDIKYVIDFCLTKSLHWDQETNLTELKLEWAAIANLKQRRGRAGRVQAGSCYRLITELFSQNLLEFPEPEVTRQPIDKLVLSVKRLDSKNKPDFLLSKLLTPPKSDKIERAILSLKEVGALTLYKNKKFCSDDGELTFAGKIMAELPIDLRFSKLILFGHVFGRLKSAIIIAAALSSKTFFTKNYKSDFEFYKGKLNWANGLFCDFNAIVNAYKVFENKQKEMSKYELKEWTRENMLEYSRLIEVKKLVEKIEGHLRDMNFINDEMQKTDDDFQHIYRSVPVTDEQEAIDECYIIKFIVAGAFYPNYFYTSQASEEDALKRLSGKDPKTTICVRKFDDTPALYHKKLIEIFSICSQDIAVHYEQFKAFVEFKKSSDIITKISLGVYLALFLKQMKREELALFKIKNGKENAKRQLEILQAEESLNYHSSVTSRITVDKMDSLSDPNLVIKDLNEFFVHITNLDQIGHFYAQINDDEHNNRLEQISECLNQSSFTNLNKYELKIGMLVATLFFDSLENNDFVRARIDKINEKNVEVFYIDYGNREQKDINLIFKLPSELSKIPYQAISCSLINMKLKDSKMLNKEWRDKAIGQFSDFLKAKKLKAKIFSIVENTVRITLFEVKTVAEIDILKTMLKLELVEYCEETQLSKDNNRQRFNMYYMNDKNLKSSSHFIKIKNITDALENIVYEDSYDKTFEIMVENPLKINLHPMTRSLHKIVNVSIGTESCNRILLDDEPETNCSSLIVASNFSKRTNNQNDRISMRETCLFSKLKGIVSLCLMTFAPYAELRVDKKDQRYTGVLCGLGFDKQNNRPINTDNDIENEFECEFDEDDFKKINAIRYCINSLIGNEVSAKIILQNQADLRKKQMDNRRQVFYLLQKNRKLIENATPYHYKFKWNMIPERCYNEESSIAFIEKKHMINKAFYMGIRTVDFYKFLN